MIEYKTQANPLCTMGWRTSSAQRGWLQDHTTKTIPAKTSPSTATLREKRPSKKKIRNGEALFNTKNKQPVKNRTSDIRNQKNVYKKNDNFFINSMVYSANLLLL